DARVLAGARHRQRVEAAVLQLEAVAGDAAVVAVADRDRRAAGVHQALHDHVGRALHGQRARLHRRLLQVGRLDDDRFGGGARRGLLGAARVLGGAAGVGRAPGRVVGARVLLAAARSTTAAAGYPATGRRLIGVATRAAGSVVPGLVRGRAAAAAGQRQGQ